MIRLGYPAQNLSIPETTNRTLRLAGLRGVERLKSIVRENIVGLRSILHWNAERGVGLFRIGQDLIPFASHPAFPYDWASEHGGELRDAGDLACSLGIRISMHPGQYIQPASPRPDVAERGIEELRYVTRVFDLMDAEDAVTVLHMGGAYGDRPGTAARFVEAMRPHADILRYLALENDERIWTASEIVETSRALNIPAITDSFHHGLNPGGLSLREALDLSLPTWEARAARPKLHLSSQDPEKRPGAHAYLVEAGDWEALLSALDGREADVMIEAKGKEQALAVMGVRVESRRERTGSGMSIHSVEEEIRNLLENSRTVAVVGLSDDPYRPSHGVARALQKFGFRIFPVNPNLTGPVLGEKPYASVEDIPEQIDIVDVFRRSEEVVPAAESAVASRAKALWMQSGVINEEAARLAAENGLTVVMDRCLAVDCAAILGR